MCIASSINQNRCNRTTFLEADSNHHDKYTYMIYIWIYDSCFQSQFAWRLQNQTRDFYTTLFSMAFYSYPFVWLGLPWRLFHSIVYLDQEKTWLRSLKCHPSIVSIWLGYVRYTRTYKGLHLSTAARLRFFKKITSLDQVSWLVHLSQILLSINPSTLSQFHARF